MPLYDLHAVAHATDLEPKQIDNLLSRNTTAGLIKRQRGIARRVGTDLVVAIRLARTLAEFLDVPTGSLLAVSERFLASGAAEIHLGEYLTLRLDHERLRRSTVARLDAAVEIVGKRRRGRPRRQAG